MKKTLREIEDSLLDDTKNLAHQDDSEENFEEVDTQNHIRYTLHLIAYY